jgi:putative transposase
MKEKLSFGAEYEQHAESMASLCRRFRISRKTGYQWVKRWAEPGGWDGRARRRGRRAWVITGRLAEQILKLREQYPWEGPRKLVTRLQQVKERPAVSTIGAFLRREGLVAKRRRHRRSVPGRSRFAPVKLPNEVWSVDRKGWFRTGNGRKCEPLTIMDNATRFLLYNRHQQPVTSRTVRAVFERLFRLYGLPERIRTDGGPPFASIGPAGLSKLSAWWIKLGIRVERIDPGRPQQNGRHERMHLTLKQQVCGKQVAQDLARQQHGLDAFRSYYNGDRPHEALGQRTPASCYHRAARFYPRVVPQLRYPASYEIRRVRTNGAIKWLDRDLYVSQALAGEVVGVQLLKDGGLRVYFATIALGSFAHGRGSLRYEPRPRSPRASKKRAGPRAAKRSRLTPSHPRKFRRPARRGAAAGGNFSAALLKPVRGRRKNCSH